MLQNDSLKFLVFAHHLSMLQACTEAVIENKVGYHLFIKHYLGCNFYILNINCSFYNWGGGFFCLLQIMGCISINYYYILYCKLYKCIYFLNYTNIGINRGRSGKESSCQCGRCKRHRFDPCVGKIPVGNDNLLQYSCLDSSMDRGAWRATVHEVAELVTTKHAHIH